MVHWLLRADPQPDLHDHPNDFISVVLRGGYIEEREGIGGLRRLKEVGFWNLVRAEDRHRIRSVRKGTITLVFANKVHRDWGFWRAEKFIGWREYHYLNDDL